MKTETATPESIAKFKAALGILNMSQSEAARAMGWKQSRLNEVLNGKVAATPMALLEACVKLGLDPHAIDPRFASTKPKRGFPAGSRPKKKVESAPDSV